MLKIVFIQTASEITQHPTLAGPRRAHRSKNSHPFYIHFHLDGHGGSGNGLEGVGRGGVESGGKEGKGV